MNTPSPCIKKCKLANPVIGENHCISCKRTLEEISEWWRLTDQQKNVILKNLPLR